jgi:hypothetical protein
LTIARKRGVGTRFLFVALSLFAVLMALVVNVPTYIAFFSGRFPIAGVVNVHALLMSTWLATFLTQAILASTGKLALHRKVGSFGIALGIVVWASMVFVEIRAMVVNPPTEPRDFDWLLPGVYCYTSFLLFFQRCRLVAAQARLAQAADAVCDLRRAAGCGAADEVVAAFVGQLLDRLCVCRCLPFPAAHRI